MRTCSAWIIATFVVLPGCGEYLNTLDNEQGGDLGEGTFSYECFGDTDFECVGNSEPSFPAAIAVGGRFALEFEPKQDRGVLPRVISAAPDAVAAVSGGLRMRRSGYTALLAVDGNREVLDMTHVRGAEIAQIKVSPDGDLAVAEVDLEIGEEQELIAVPHDANGVALSGSLEYRWQSADDTVLQLETLGEVSRVRVRAAAPGSTFLIVKTGAETFELEVNVQGETSISGEPDGGAPRTQSSRKEAVPAEGQSVAPAENLPLPGARDRDAGGSDGGGELTAEEPVSVPGPGVLDAGAWDGAAPGVDMDAAADGGVQ